MSFDGIHLHSINLLLRSMYFFEPQYLLLIQIVGHPSHTFSLFQNIPRSYRIILCLFLLKLIFQHKELISLNFIEPFLLFPFLRWGNFGLWLILFLLLSVRYIIRR